VFAEVARVDCSLAAIPATSYCPDREGIRELSVRKGHMQRNSLASPNRSLETAACKGVFKSRSVIRNERSLSNRFKWRDWSPEPSFQTLVSEADLELVNLLREVDTSSEEPSGSSAQSHWVSQLLTRAVECAVKQYLLREQLSNLAFTDELTGLYNRRGFVPLTERQMRLGRRSGREMMLFFVDVDGLKRINDSFGHSEGDLALTRTAKVLRNTFRDSDVLARLGGDEFAALAIEATGHSEALITARLRRNLETASTKDPRYPLSLSLGVVRFDPRTKNSITQLMLQADKAMYEHKAQRGILTQKQTLTSPLVRP
jgi:diguanylate cyclase (GGDEF)-like protein